MEEKNLELKLSSEQLELLKTPSTILLPGKIVETTSPKSSPTRIYIGKDIGKIQAPYVPSMRRGPNVTLGKSSNQSKKRKRRISNKTKSRNRRKK